MRFPSDDSGQYKESSVRNVFKASYVQNICRRCHLGREYNINNKYNKYNNFKRSQLCVKLGHRDNLILQ